MSTSHQNERITSGIVYILFFFCNKASKPEVYFTRTAHLSSHQPHFKRTPVRAAGGLRNWTVRVLRAAGQGLAQEFPIQSPESPGAEGRCLVQNMTSQPHLRRPRSKAAGFPPISAAAQAATHAAGPRGLSARGIPGGSH